ncbi:U-scoloptoxin(05)-Sm1a-like [Palaemon carinicauda]|uniref:U-scoloptoxin(05)-Sm1a-like n=1 Tax=Palaemon carinicauda TaxID=392227 RepID=UPI0035B645EF
MFSLPMKVVAIAIVAFAVFQTGYCMKCYMGAEDKTIKIPCSGSCLKATGKFYGKDIVSAYSCAIFKLKERCMEATYLLVSAEVCHCNTDLCNSSSVSSLAFPLLLGALLKMVI